MGAPAVTIARLVFAPAAVAAYVLTFRVAGNGCWFDVAAAAGVALFAAWVAAGGLLAVTRPTGQWGDAYLAAPVPGTALLLAGAAINLLIFRTTGVGTLGAKVAALLFFPFHAGLLAVADAVSAGAFVALATRRGVGLRTGCATVLFSNIVLFAAFYLLQSLSAA